MDRLKRIEELMRLDPAPDTAEGQELNRLVDEQVRAERGICEPDGTVLLGSIEQRAYLFVCQSAKRMAIERCNARQAGIQDFADFVFVLDGERVEFTYEEFRRRLFNGG